MDLLATMTERQTGKGYCYNNDKGKQNMDHVTTMTKVDMKQACYYDDKGRPEMDLAATMTERQEMDRVTTMPKVDKKWILLLG